ncbi:class I mannose-6-phosphate isomerase [Mucilaginibacter sp. KACC 22063]|uniref:class I mannose-6-phosphate isomerase n=1 Tax=Mucilaginibacter sp. KACC 22063 TaxID=3025666 RepID=UPI0023664299|nr:class I mannose-6-phosphate isomerase [Mucilaginibacter sp. KACC 22063]WDF57326.1 class I mannose-6-phosphate isomerase [Mucilaginibacter sp. KACC 22063]
MSDKYNLDPTIHAEQQLQLRKTEQFLMPAQLPSSLANAGTYNIYPTAKIGSGKIFSGFESLADYISQSNAVIIDGYVGVFWDRIKDSLQSYFQEKGLNVNWIHTSDYFKHEHEIDQLISPFLGEHRSVWGTKTNLALADIFTENLFSQSVDKSFDLNIIIGSGAALSNWDAPIIYIDLPKNELQFRMRAGSIHNLGATAPDEPFQMYKRFYFVDWVILNNHKKDILHKISVFADAQWLDTINWMHQADLLAGLKHVSTSVFRVRPWFEPGAWGGQWMKEHISNLNTDVVNLAWSFELIVPENGIVFQSDDNLLEVSFDMLMFSNHENVLGRHAETFGFEFPIRFDFLDTFKGGNLSIQCHPRLKYIQENFGETITQDETYYILDCDEKASVYLGFQENIEPDTYRTALEKSQNTGQVLEIEDFVQVHSAKKHDLFLIPNGTVHSAGAGNLVLEISATPYIFTFKMYDWVRLDLDGKPRPINIEHAFNNLDFNRKGELVKDELISKPVVIEETSEYSLIHLPTHKEHFYDVHRLEFDDTIQINQDNTYHVLMLVEGTNVTVVTDDGTEQSFAYAETFVIPAATGGYRLINHGTQRAKVIKAFLK